MNSENSAHQTVRLQAAQAMYSQGQLRRRKDAAVIAEVAPSTFTHRIAGRRSAEDYGKTRQLLAVGEGSVLVWGCGVLQRSGWSQTPEDVRILALETVQKRDPDAKVSKDWVRHSLYKCHPEIKLRRSQ